MGFVTIPDISNMSVLVNTNEIVVVTIEQDGRITLHMSNQLSIETTMPRQILVDMLIKSAKTPIPVQTSTEWAG